MLNRGPVRTRFTPVDFALYAVVVFVWGFSWIGLHLQLGTVAPEISLVWRLVIAAPVMFAMAAVRGERLNYGLRTHLAFAGFGVALFCTNFTLYYYAGLTLASGLLAVMFSLSSVINVWLGAALFRTPVDRRVAVGGLLGFIGIAAMFYPQMAGAAFSRDVLIGIALCIAGTLSFCIGNMISAHLQQRSIPVFAATGYGMLYGIAALSFLALVRGHAFTIDWSATYLISLLYLGLIGSAIGFACYLTLLGRIGADRAAYTTVMFPVVALIVSTLFEGYQWTAPAALGLVAVLAGNLLVLRPSAGGNPDIIPPPEPHPTGCRAKK